MDSPGHDKNNDADSSGTVEQLFKNLKLIEPKNEHSIYNMQQLLDELPTFDKFVPGAAEINGVYFEKGMQQRAKDSLENREVKIEEDEAVMVPALDQASGRPERRATTRRVLLSHPYRRRALVEPAQYQEIDNFLSLMGSRTDQYPTPLPAHTINVPGAISLPAYKQFAHTKSENTENGVEIGTMNPQISSQVRRIIPKRGIEEYHEVEAKKFKKF